LAYYSFTLRILIAAFMLSMKAPKVTEKQRGHRFYRLPFSICTRVILYEMRSANIPCSSTSLASTLPWHTFRTSISLHVKLSPRKSEAHNGAQLPPASLVQPDGHGCDASNCHEKYRSVSFVKTAWINFALLDRWDDRWKISSEETRI
jgi:hypothetical protein